MAPGLCHLNGLHHPAQTVSTEQIHIPYLSSLGQTGSAGGTVLVDIVAVYDGSYTTAETPVVCLNKRKVPLQKLIFLGSQTGPAEKSLSRENFQIF